MRTLFLGVCLLVGGFLGGWCGSASGDDRKVSQTEFDIEMCKVRLWALEKCEVRASGRPHVIAYLTDEQMKYAAQGQSGPDEHTKMMGKAVAGALKIHMKSIVDLGQLFTPPGARTPPSK